MKVFIHTKADSGTCHQRRKGQIATRPAMDLVEGEDGISLFCDMPGVAPDSLRLCLVDGTLHLWGETDFAPALEGRIHALEFDAMVYEASFALPPALSDSAIEARLCKGVLTVLFRPAVKSRSRKIPVNAE